MSQLLKKAFILSFITITYNIAEGLISIYFGMNDETLALFGFGVDSFVEVISGIGIAHMVFRMKYSQIVCRDKFEITALRITGISFYILTAGLVVGSIANIILNVKPETTLIGIIVSSISVLTMYYLMKAKLVVGKELNSAAIIADANCTKTCFYLSFILLASSLLFELTEIGFIDSVGSLGIAYFTFSEGREAFKKINSGNLSCSCDDECHTK
ncbi:MAG: hypothetical protein KJ799_14765 [Bacteroidetes bacterium]|nr:hypothetical protein [Bacteroidota bacterium]